MATNKNALIRYKVLDRCFSNSGKKYFIEDLIEASSLALDEIKPNNSGISRRQVLEDIKFMESAEGWNIELVKTRENRRVYYRYADPAFSINNMPLTETDINNLKSAIEVLSQFKGMPQFEWLQGILPKLHEGVFVKNAPVLDFDSNIYLKGIENLGVLYNAIVYKKVLSITYQSFQAVAPYDVIIHPYYLKQYNNRWFLLGYNPLIGKPDWNLAIDRIISINETHSKYKPNKEINWDDYFEDFMGVTKTENEKCMEVVLHFFGVQGKYVESKPLHGSQKSKWINTDTLEVSLELIPNYELERLILSYADSVKVIKPVKLAKRIAEKMEKATDYYRD